MTVKVFERGSGGLFGGDQLVGEATIPLSKFIFAHSRDDSLGVTATLTKKDASRGDVVVYAEATGVSAVIDALGSALAPAGSQVPQLFSWACETLANLSKQNKLKFQQYASAELLDSLASLTLAAHSATSSEKRRDKDKGKGKDKKERSKVDSVKLDDTQRAKLATLWKSMVEQELRKSLIANGLFSHLNKFLDPTRANEELLLLALDLCKPFFTVASHQRELVAQGVSTRIIKLVESTSLAGAALSVPVPDRVRSKGLDCLLYFDTPLHSDLVDLGLGSALIALIAHKTIAAQLRLRCLELLTTLDADQQRKMVALEEQNEAKGVSGGGLVANLLSLLQDATQPALQLKSLSYLNSTLAAQDSVLDALVKRGLLLPLVRMLSQSSTPTTATHVGQLRNMSAEIIKKVQPRFAEYLCFETSFVRDLSVLLLIQESLAVELLSLFLSTKGSSDATKKAKDALLLSKGLAMPNSESTSVPVAPKIPILRICAERLMGAGTRLTDAKLVELGLPAVFLDFYPYEQTDSTLISFSLLTSWGVTPRDVADAVSWETLVSALSSASHPKFLLVLDWIAAQDWSLEQNKPLALKTAPRLLRLIGAAIPDEVAEATPSASSDPEASSSSLDVGNVNLNALQPEGELIDLTRLAEENKESDKAERPQRRRSPVQLTIQEEYDPRSNDDAAELDHDDEDEQILSSTPPPQSTAVHTQIDLEPFLIEFPDIPDDLLVDGPDPSSAGPNEPSNAPNPPFIPLTGEFLARVWKLCISWAETLGKHSDWKLAPLLFSLLERDTAAMPAADLETLFILIAPKKGESSTPLFEEWLRQLRSDAAETCQQLFRLWQNSQCTAFAAKLLKIAVRDHADLLSQGNISSVILPQLLLLCFSSAVIRRQKAIGIIPRISDWEHIILKEPGLLKTLLDGAVVPLNSGGSSSLAAPIFILRELLTPVWRKTGSAAVFGPEMQLIDAIVAVFAAAASSASSSLLTAIQSDKTYRDYLIELFAILEWTPVVPRLLEPSQASSLQRLVEALFFMPNGSLNGTDSFVLAPVFEFSLDLLSKLLSAADASRLRMLTAGGQPLAFVGAFLLRYTVRSKDTSPSLDKAASLREQLDNAVRLENAPKLSSSSLDSVLRALGGDDTRFLSFLVELLASSRPNLIAISLHAWDRIDPALWAPDHAKLVSLVHQPTVVGSLDEACISLLVGLLERIDIDKWLAEGVEIYSTAPPTLEGAVAMARRLLRRKAPAPAPVLTAEAEAEAMPPPSEQAPSSSSGIPPAPASGGAGAAGAVPDTPEVISEFQPNVIATWFSPAGLAADKVLYVPLFDSKTDVPSNSELLKALEGKSNVMVVVRTRSKWCFGAFTVKGIPTGITAAPGSVRDVSAFLFALSRPNGPPQPQKFSIRYSEANNAVGYQQGKFSLSFGRDDIGINLDSAVEKVKVSESGNFSYLLPSNTASRSFFTGSTYIDFEQLLAFQVVDKSLFKGSVIPKSTPASVPAPVALTRTISVKKAPQSEEKHEKTAVSLMDRRLAHAISDVIGHLIEAHVSLPKWNQLSRCVIPGSSTEDIRKLFTGEGIDTKATAHGPRLLIFNTDDNSVFGIFLSPSNVSQASGWIKDPNAALFSIIHGSPKRESVVPQRIVLPALVSLVGHFYIGNSTLLVGQGTDLFVDLNTGISHANPGITFDLPKSKSFQSAAAHGVLNGSSGRFKVNSITMWGVCPSHLLPHYQRPTLPLLRSLLSSLNSRSLAELPSKRWYNEISAAVKRIIVRISEKSVRRGLQVEEELLRVYMANPTATTSDDESTQPVSKPFPFKSPILNTLLEMRFPGMSVLPYSITSPTTEGTRYLNSENEPEPAGLTGNLRAPDDEEQDLTEPTLHEYAFTLAPLESCPSGALVTHVILEPVRGLSGSVVVLQTKADADSFDPAIVSQVRDGDGPAVAEEWYRSNAPESRSMALRGGDSESNDAISEEAELASTQNDEIYELLPLRGDLTESGARAKFSKRSREYDLPSFYPAHQNVFSFSSTDSSTPDAPIAVTLPCALAAHRIVVCGAYSHSSDLPAPTAYLRQIVVVGFIPTKAEQIPPVPKSVSDVDNVFFLPRSFKNKSMKVTRMCAYAFDGDTNGVMAVLGTCSSPEEVGDAALDRRSIPWKNPITSDKISFNVSHGFYNKATMNVELVTSQPTLGGGATCFWGGSAPVWFIVNLNNWKLEMTHFTLRHGYHYDNSFPTDVVMFGASSDSGTPADSDWQQLWASKDPIFEKSFEVRTFPVSSSGNHFNYFKFLQHGSYTMGKSNAAGAPFLPISGFEMYGHLEYDLSAELIEDATEESISLV